MKRFITNFYIIIDIFAKVFKKIFDSIIFFNKRWENFIFWIRYKYPPSNGITSRNSEEKRVIPGEDEVRDQVIGESQMD